MMGCGRIELEVYGAWGTEYGWYGGMGSVWHGGLGSG